MRLHHIVQMCNAGSQIYHSRIPSMAPGARKKTPETGVAASVTLEQSSDSVPSSAPAVSDEDLLSRVDMRKPIIPQVYHLLHVPVSRGGLSKALYLRWVHTPHYFKEEPKYMRFFESEWREALSKVGGGRHAFRLALAYLARRCGGKPALGSAALRCDFTLHALPEARVPMPPAWQRHPSRAA